MTFGDILFGFLIASGFFVSAFVARFFRRTSTGVLLGGVVGLGVSVALLYYGLTEVFELPAPE
ncbi:MAG: hypothetical protein AAFU41_20745 [Pseudomonadota bacterium]